LELTRDDIARLVASGDLRRVRQGVFAMRHAWVSQEDDVAAWLHFDRDRLPWERAGRSEAFLSNDSAAALHGLGTIIAGQPTVTIPVGGRRSARAAGIVVRRAPMRPEDWVWLDVGPLKLPVTSPARTIVDVLLDGHEPSYVRRAITEAIVGNVATPELIMDAARHRKSASKALQARVAKLLETAA
jgi:hypothetical protein